jgi:hypothetical protein
MLQCDNREIVNTCDHLTTQVNEPPAADRVSGAMSAPEVSIAPLCHCAVQKF